MGCDELFVVQNKIDLVSETQAINHYEQIHSFLSTALGSREKAAAIPVIPTAAVSDYNIDVLCETLANLPIPKRNMSAPAQMVIIRSFDVNFPGANPLELVGGVAGGSLIDGRLKIGQEIEIRPGLVTQNVDPVSKKTTLHVRPLRSKVRTLMSGTEDLVSAVPGGLIAVGTGLDPMLTTKDRLVGHVLGAVGSLPEVYTKFEMSYVLIKRLVDHSETATTPTVATLPPPKRRKRPARAPKLSVGEKIQLNINSRRTLATVLATKVDLVKVELHFPCCIGPGQRISICRKVDHSFRLCGIGLFQAGEPIVLEK